MTGGDDCEGLAGRDVFASCEDGTGALLMNRASGITLERLVGFRDDDDLFRRERPWIFDGASRENRCWFYPIFRGDAIERSTRLRDVARLRLRDLGVRDDDAERQQKESGDTYRCELA